MSDTDKPFTVSDRRHFTPEGRPRDDAPTGGSPSVAASPAAMPQEAQARPAPGATEPRPAARPMEFAQFLLSLGAQAGMLLSGAGQPDGGDPLEALDGASSIISILEMLEDKTQGRRTPDEDKVLEGLLFELRMAYVERRRAVKA